MRSRRTSSSSWQSRRGHKLEEHMTQVLEAVDLDKIMEGAACPVLNTCMPHALSCACGVIVQITS